MDALAVVPIYRLRVHQRMSKGDLTLHHNTLQKMTKYKDIKIEEETIEKFYQAKRLREFKMNGKLTMSEFMEIILEAEFKRYDGKVIENLGHP